MEGDRVFFLHPHNHTPAGKKGGGKGGRGQVDKFGCDGAK